MATDFDIEEAQTRAEARADEPSRDAEGGRPARKPQGRRQSKQYVVTVEGVATPEVAEAARQRLIRLLSDMLD